MQVKLFISVLLLIIYPPIGIASFGIAYLTRKKSEPKKSINVTEPVAEIDRQPLRFKQAVIDRGYSHERLVSIYLSTLDKNKYTVINNVMLPSNGNTSYTQIDHVVVSRYGIFCIETKSTRGWIYGSDDKQNWTQMLKRSTHDFYSPTRQNYAHVQALKLLLGTKTEVPVTPIVVFTDALELFVKSIYCVGNIGCMLRKIDSYDKLVFSSYEYKRIVDQIKFANTKDNKIIYDHNIEVGNLTIASY